MAADLCNYLTNINIEVGFNFLFIFELLLINTFVLIRSRKSLTHNLFSSKQNPASFCGQF